MSNLTECWTVTTMGGITPLVAPLGDEGEPDWDTIRKAIGARLLEPRSVIGSDGSVVAMVYCDEEGFFSEQPYQNMLASRLLGGPIVGDVVVRCAPDTLFKEVNG